MRAGIGLPLGLIRLERRRWWKQWQQESPSAWTQEAYRPRRIKYSIYYLRWGTSWQGYPSPGQVCLEGCPRWGTPLAGVPPSQVCLWGYLRWGTPPSGPGWTNPPPRVDRQMDRHVSKHNLPVVLCTQSVKTDSRTDSADKLLLW